MNIKSLKNQEFFQENPDRLNDIFFVVDRNLIFNYMNKKSEIFIGVSNKKSTGRSMYEILPKLKGSDVDKIILKTLEKRQSQSILTEYQIDGEKSLSYITTHPVGDKVSVLIRDINEYIKKEDLRKLGSLILERLNKLGEFRELIRDIILLVKTYTEFDAVGIRLRDGVDYPYYITKGFSSNFIKTESKLCTKNKSGNLIFDKKGNPYLDCMCGNIIMGRTDSKLPFFTKGGSFWTNSTTNLLATTNEKELKTHTRNRCNSCGYESVALIPLQTDNEIVGLLQLNDKRENMLPLDTIKTLEGYAASIAVALSRYKAINALKISEQRYNLAQKAANIGSWDWDIESGKINWSEKIEPLFGFKKGKFKGTYDAFLECVHPDDKDFVVISVNDCLKHKKRYMIEHRIIWPDGSIKWVLEQGDVIRGKDGKPIRMLGVVQDITDKKEKEDLLKQRKEDLEKIVDERTSELLNLNKKLKDEIAERKKAEAYNIRTKENLRNVIDSASEIIISFDVNNRISIWNKTAENVTGYKQIEVLNRSVGKLEVFENPDNILNFIKNVYLHKVTKSNDVILNTKDNEKRIIRVSGKDINGLNNECVGALFIGNDITKDIELHKRLLEGNSYLITDKYHFSSFDLLIDLTNNDLKGLIITRGNPNEIKKLIPESKNIEIALLTNEEINSLTTISSLEKLKDKFIDFSKNNKKSVILLDGVHYLLSQFSFQEFNKLLYDINDMVVKYKAILFVRIDPSIIDDSKMGIIENELLVLPSQKTEDLIIEDDIYNILKYIFEQNSDNAIVSVKKVMSRFNIAYVTTASKLDSLEIKGLIFSKKQGKLRALFITEKGKKLLHKRKIE
jgi:PAS domain S-box-containing protein